MGQVYGAQAFRDRLPDYSIDEKYTPPLEDIVLEENNKPTHLKNDKGVSQIELKIYLERGGSLTIFSDELIITRVCEKNTHERLLSPTQDINHPSKKLIKEIKGIPDFSSSYLIYNQRGYGANYTYRLIKMDFVHFFWSLETVIMKRAFLKEYKKCMGYDDSFTLPKEYKEEEYNYMYEREVKWMYETILSDLDNAAK